MGNAYRWPDSAGSRIPYFDNAKGGLILLVVLGHLFDVYYGLSPYAKIGYVWIYMFHMPLFIFISGLFSKQLFETNGRFRGERIISMLVLCFSLLLLERSISWCFFDVPFNKNFLTFSNSPWYLFALAAWSLSVPLVRELKPWFVIGSAILLALYVGYLPYETDFLVYSRIVVYFPFFLMGYYMELNRIRVFVKSSYVPVALILLSCAAAAFYLIPDLLLVRPTLTGRNNYVMSLGEYAQWGPLVRLFYYPCAIATGILFLNLIPRTKTWLAKWGAQSLQIFYLQTLFIPIFQRTRLSSIFAELGGWYPVLLIPLAMIICSVFSARFLSYPFRKLMSYDWRIIRNENISKEVSDGPIIKA